MEVENIKSGGHKCDSAVYLFFTEFGRHVPYFIFLETSIEVTYHISRTIRHAFFPEKCDLKSTCVLYAEGKYLFPNL